MSYHLNLDVSNSDEDKFENTFFNEREYFF